MHMLANLYAMLMGLYKELQRSVKFRRLLTAQCHLNTPLSMGSFLHKRKPMVCGTTHLYKKVRERSNFCTMAKTQTI